MEVSLVKGVDRRGHEPLLHAMFQARKRLFQDRLEWHVGCDSQAREIDDRDGSDAIYLILHDTTAPHLGSMRLLPTTEKTLLGNAFATVLDVDSVQAPAIWECSRLCIEGSADKTTSDTTSRLLLGLCETASRSGISHILGSFHASMLPAFAAAGWIPDLLGQSGEGSRAIYLGCWTASAHAATALRKAADLHGSILNEAARHQAARLLSNP